MVVCSPAEIRRHRPGGGLAVALSLLAFSGCGATDEALGATDEPGAALDADFAASGDYGRVHGETAGADGSAGGSGGNDQDVGPDFPDQGLTGGAGGAGGAGGGWSLPDFGVLPPEPPTRDEACAWMAGYAVDGAVLDRDGDCFPNDCTGLHESCTRYADCDDQRPDVNPGIAERCNGRDDDCDGLDDEDFAIGGPCQTTCGDGKWECAHADPTQVACSTAAGQSQAPPPDQVREVCNDLDDDCDGVVDDDCRFELPVAAQRSRPVACAGRLFVVQDDALVEVDRDGIVETLAPAGDELPVAPVCGAAGIAWLSLPMNGGLCETPENEPERCYGRILARRLGDGPGTAPIEVATPGAHGRPAVSETDVLWHSVLGQTLGIYTRPLAPGGVSRRVADGQSDPALAGPAAGASPYVATRRWVSGQAQVYLQRLDDPHAGLAIINPVAPPGPPIYSGAWLVWDIPGALWGVPMSGEDFSEPGDGLQLIEHADTDARPLVEGRHLVWLDRTTTPPSVRLVDLETGLSRVVVRADVRPGDLALSDGVLFTVRQEAPDAGLYRTELP